MKRSDQPHHGVHRVLDDDDGDAVGRERRRIAEHLLDLLRCRGRRASRRAAAAGAGRRARVQAPAGAAACSSSPPPPASASSDRPTRIDRLAARAHAPRASSRVAHEGADHDVVEHGHARERSHDLEGAADAEPADAIGRQADDERPVDSSLAAVGAQEAVQQIEQRGLAGAVRPDDADDLAGARR